MTNQETVDKIVDLFGEYGEYFTDTRFSGGKRMVRMSHEEFRRLQKQQLINAIYDKKSQDD